MELSEHPPLDHRPAVRRRPAREGRRPRGIRPAPDVRLAAGRSPARAHRAALRLPRARSRPRPPARLPDHDHRAAEASGDEPAARLRLRHPWARPLPRQRLLPAREPGGRLPHHPHDDQVARGAEAPVLAARVHGEAARARARHRPDRLGQVDHARVPDRRDQPHPHRPHHHDRGSDRVPAQPQALHRQPARGRPGRHRLRRRRCGGRCARTPT